MNVTSDAYQPTYNPGPFGGSDTIFLSFNRSLNTLLYGSYFGGSDDDEGGVRPYDVSVPH